VRLNGQLQFYELNDFGAGLNVRYIFGLRKKEKSENMFDTPENTYK
jgi:hypothetical protein